MGSVAVENQGSGEPPQGPEKGRGAEAKFLRMTTTPVSRLIPSLAVPTMVSMVVTALYNMADTYFVGKIGTSATGAVGVVFSVMTTIQVIGMTLGVGSGSYVARLMGKRDTERASSVVSTAFFTALVAGLVLAVAGELSLDRAMRYLGATETILPYAKAYASVILLGSPFMAATFVMNVNLRSEGSAVLSMVGIASGAIINIALDPLFIFVFHMGIAGAATATILSQFISFWILASHYLAKRSALRLRLSVVTLDRSTYREILVSGTPTFARQLIATVAAVSLNVAASAYGDASVAGMAVVTRFMLFLWSMLIGFGQGFQPVAAMNYTAGKLDRVYAAFWFSVKTAALFLSAFAAVCFVFAPEIVRVFRDDPEVVRIGAFALRAQCLVLPLSSYIVMANMMFQYIGKPLRSTILALSRQGLVFLPALLILGTLFGLKGIQMSQAAADLVTFILSIALTGSTLRYLREGKPSTGSETSARQ